MYEHQNFPKYLYHASKPPVVVNDQTEADALGAGWVEAPVEAPAEPEKKKK